MPLVPLAACADEEEAAAEAAATAWKDCKRRSALSALALNLVMSRRRTSLSRKQLTRMAASCVFEEWAMVDGEGKLAGFGEWSLSIGTAGGMLSRPGERDMCGSGTGGGGLRKSG